MKGCVHLVGEVQAAPGLFAAWRALETRAAPHSRCQTATYAEVGLDAAIRHGESGFIVEVEDAGRVVGAWALVRRREGLFQTLRSVSSGSFAEYGAPLVEAGLEDAATAAALKSALTIPADRLLLTTVAQNSPLERAVVQLGGRRHPGSIQGFSVGTGRFPNWDAYIAASSRSHAKGVRYNLRGLQQLGRVDIGWCKTADEARAVLNWTWRTKQAWARARRIDTPWLKDDRVHAFYTALAERADLSSDPLVSFVKLNGEPIAALISLMGRQTLEFFIPTFDERFAKHSPGELLFQENLRWAVERGVDADFRVLEVPYKTRIADTVTTYATYEFAGTLWGRSAAPLAGRWGRLWRRARRAPGKAMQLGRHQAARVQRRVRRETSDWAQQFEDARIGIRTHVRVPRGGFDPTLLRSAYEPVRYRALRQISDALRLGSEDVLFDVGSGRGRIVCFFARSRLKKVVGIEFDPDLVAAAQRNVESMKGRMSPAEIIQGDAADQDYDEATVLFLYHPFNEPIMGRFLRQLRASLKRRPRAVTLIYCCPVCKGSVINIGFGQPTRSLQVSYGAISFEVAIWDVPPFSAPQRAGGRKGQDKPSLAPAGG